MTLDNPESIESVGHFPSMWPFPLLTLPVHLVEAIITKTDSISNFRLRRTCRDVRDLIQISHRIFAVVDKNFSIKWNGSDLQICRSQYCSSTYSTTEVVVDAEGCYGIRLRSFYPYQDVRNNYIELCQFLRKYRITCAIMEDLDSFSPDQIVTLLKLLKPINIYRYQCSNTGLLEAILSSKSLNRVRVREVDPMDAVSTMKKLVSRFPAVEIAVVDVKEPAPLLHEIQKALLSMDLSAVSQFTLCMQGSGRPSRNQFEQDFPGLQWTYELDDRHFRQETFSAVIDTPPHFSRSSSCTFYTYCEEGRDGWYGIEYSG